MIISAKLFSILTTCYFFVLVLLRANAKLLRRTPFGRNIRDMLTLIHVLCDCYAKVFCGLNVF